MAITGLSGFLMSADTAHRQSIGGCHTLGVLDIGTGWQPQAPSAQTKVASGISLLWGWHRHRDPSVWNETFSSSATEIIRRKIRTFHKAHLDILDSYTYCFSKGYLKKMWERKQKFYIVCIWTLKFISTKFYKLQFVPDCFMMLGCFGTDWSRSADPKVGSRLLCFWTDTT